MTVTFHALKGVPVTFPGMKSKKPSTSRAFLVEVLAYRPGRATTPMPSRQVTSKLKEIRVLASDQFEVALAHVDECDARLVCVLRNPVITIELFVVHNFDSAVGDELEACKAR